MQTSHPPRRRARLVGAAAAATLVIGGCGGDDAAESDVSADITATGDAPPSTSTSATSPTTPTTAASAPVPRRTTTSSVDTSSPPRGATARVIITLVADADPQRAARELDETLDDHGSVTRIFEFSGQLLAEVDETGRTLLEEHPSVSAVDDDTADAPDG